MNRFVRIDQIRVFAALGIIWFHAIGIPGRYLGVSGLYIFLMIFSALIFGRKNNGVFISYIKRKTLRLIFPWVSWSIIYCVFKLAKSMVSNTGQIIDFKGIVVLVGTNMHLWYLPYVFIMSILLYLIDKFINNKNTNNLVVLIPVFIGVIVLYLSLIINSKYNLPFPINSWLISCPAILFGSAIGLYLCSDLAKKINIYVICILSLIGCLLVGFNINCWKTIIAYCIALPIVCFGFNYKGEEGECTRRFGGLAYGIYLVHPVMFTIARLIFHDNIGIVGIVFVVFILSLGFSYLLNKTTLKLII